MLKRACLGLLIVSAPSLAQEPLKVVGYPLASVAVYDEKGAFLGDMQREQLPALEVPVISFNEERNLILIQQGAKELWLDPLDVKLNHGKTVPFDCREIVATSQKVDRKAAVTMGYSEHCSQ